MAISMTVKRSAADTTGFEVTLPEKLSSIVNFLWSNNCSEESMLLADTIFCEAMKVRGAAQIRRQCKKGKWSKTIAQEVINKYNPLLRNGKTAKKVKKPAADAIEQFRCVVLKLRKEQGNEKDFTRSEAIQDMKLYNMLDKNYPETN